MPESPDFKKGNRLLVDRGDHTRVENVENAIVRRNVICDAGRDVCIGRIGVLRQQLFHIFIGFFHALQAFEMVLF